MVMINNIIKKLEKYFLIGALYLATASLDIVYADDFSKGARGPENRQLDVRTTYSVNEKDVETITNNVILKYWDGDEFGKFAFISIPYKFINSPKGSDNGIGDISLGLGPRGRIDNLHWFLYGSLTFPTGEAGLGNKRDDAKAGALATCFIDEKRFEIDGILEHNFTGENNSGTNPPNETYAGFLVGRKVTKKTRAGIGLTELIKDNGDYITNWKVALRYTASPKLHFELVGDKGIYSRNMSESTGIGLFTRYNW